MSYNELARSPAIVGSNKFSVSLTVNGRDPASGRALTTLLDALRTALI
jgi:hypothetical protein